MNDMTWGIRPDEKPEPWWGARAIFKAPDGIDLLWDRQSFKGSKDDGEAMNKWLNEKGLPGLKKVLKAEGVRGSEFREVCFESDGYKIVANPRESYGYLYIGAWEACKAD